MLLLDVGNTSMKWNGWNQRGQDDVITVAHGGSLPEAALATWRRMERPSRVVVANVAGQQMRHALHGWMSEQWGLAPEFIVSKAQGWGVINAYRHPQCLGADRWAALIAARATVAGRACCVVDCGSALTIDVLDAGGRHLGGLIMPGLAMMRQSLIENTAGVELVAERDERDDNSLLACDTREAVLGGTLYATVALIDRVVADIGESLGAEPHYLLTGGGGVAILPLLSANFQYIDALVLKGLAIIAGERP